MRANRNEPVSAPFWFQSLSINRRPHGDLLHLPAGFEQAHGQQAKQDEQAADDFCGRRFHREKDGIPADHEHRNDGNQLDAAGDTPVLFPVSDHRAERPVGEQPPVPFLRRTGEAGGREQHERRRRQQG